jgi:hypothetical protein
MNYLRLPASPFTLHTVSPFWRRPPLSPSSSRPACRFSRLALLAALGSLILALAFEAPAASAQAAISAQAATADPPPVHLKRALVMVSGVDPQAGQLAILEKLTLQNAGDTPYEPARWEDSAARFGVPAGARNVSIAMGPPGAQLVAAGGAAGAAAGAATANQYALAAPLPPGEHSLVLSYALAYGSSAGTARVTSRLAMPAEAVQVLVPAAPGVSLLPLGGAFAAATPIDMGGQKYLLLEGKQLAAGVEIGYELRGLPAAGAGTGTGGAPRPAALTPPYAGLPEGTLLVTSTIVLAVALVYGLARGAARAPALSGATAARAWRTGHEALQSLEAQHAAGVVTADTYHVSRLKLKAQLAALGRSRAGRLSRRLAPSPRAAEHGDDPGVLELAQSPAAGTRELAPAGGRAR